LEGINGREHSKMHARIKIKNGLMPPQFMCNGEKHPLRKGKTIAIDLKTNKIKFIMMGERDVISHGFSNPTVNHIINGKRGRLTHKGFTFKRISDDVKLKIGDIYDSSKKT
jgi:hypothetical protein